MEIKDKPPSMSVREWITKKIALDPKIGSPELIIKQVINHQFDSGQEALKTNNSIEISGFGKFFYNEKKAKREIERCTLQKATYEEQLINSKTTEKERLSIGKKLVIISKKLTALINKEQ